MNPHNEPSNTDDPLGCLGWFTIGVIILAIIALAAVK
jgi:hypothetical protein